MTEQGALHETVSTLKMMITAYKKKATPQNPYKATIKSLDSALQCVEKQIAKKPIIKSVWSVAKCPCCGAELGKYVNDGYPKNWESLKFCECGQKLDWSEV